MAQPGKVTSKRKVVLFYPPYDGPPLGAPLSLLCLASPLLQAGFEVKLVDNLIAPDYEQTILRETADALCLGISVLTGPHIGAAIRVARAVKKLRPELPVVFGGWHASLATEQTLHEPFVDAIVRGQGELTLLELVQRIAAGKDWHGVKGLSFNDGGMISHQPERPVANINDLPAPAYYLADPGVYAAASGVRQLAYTSSVGCPYQCNYCTDQVFYKRRFNAYRVERVINELVELVPRYNIEHVPFFDSNFLVDRKRAVAIARGIIDSRTKFQWDFQTSTDFLATMLSEEDVRTLAEAGAHHIGFGTESASQEILTLMNKRFQHVEQMAETCSQD